MAATSQDKGLQGIRGWSSLSVVLYHVSLPTIVGSLLIGWGWAAVVLFFVVSGHILGKKWLAGDYHRPAPGGRRFDAARYFARRFWRIWPVYLLTLPMFVLLGLFPFEWQLFGMAQYLVPLYSPTGFPLMPQWTLAIEEIFYATLPLWVIAVGGKRWILLLGALAAVSVASSFFVPLWFELPQYAVAYVFGLMSARGIRLRLPLSVTVPLVVGAMVAVNLWRYTDPLTVLIASLASWVIVTEWRRTALFTNRWSSRLGNLTYPLYLVGIPALAITHDLLGTQWAWGLLSVPAAVSIAWALHRGVEGPLIRMGRRLEGRTPRLLAPEARSNSVQEIVDKLSR